MQGFDQRRCGFDDRQPDFDIDSSIPTRSIAAESQNF
jgi:hypothetical protein